MKITNTRIRLVKGPVEDLKLKAYVDLTFDDCFVVHGLKIIEGQNGLFIAMPSKKVSATEFRDIVHPINPDFRREITDHVLEQYDVELKKEPVEE